MDEAYELFRECKRVMMDNGVLRISVPDADLRKYASPEPLAYDAGTGKSARVDWNHPDVHKTRWSVYSLGLLLELAGFYAVPLAYCDRFGKFHCEWPREGCKEYSESADWEIICEDKYIRRMPSLVIDGVINRGLCINCYLQTDCID